MSEVKFSYDGDAVVFKFDSMGMNTEEMFKKWVQFMNAISYILDPVEMENMWNGITSDEEKIPSEEVTRYVIAELEYQMQKQKIDFSNYENYYKAVEETIKEMEKRLAAEWGMFT